MNKLIDPVANMPNRSVVGEKFLEHTQLRPYKIFSGILELISEISIRVRTHVVAWLDAILFTACYKLLHDIFSVR